MSQTQDDLNQPQVPEGSEQGVAPEEDAREFDMGFDIQSDDAIKDGENALAEGADTPSDEEAQAQPGRQEEAAPAPQVFSEPEPAPTPQPQPAPREQPTEPKQLESIPEEIAEELKNLEAISPAAAKLAMEDSPEGAAVRERLADFGSAMAQDRAEFVLAQREQVKKETAAEAERNAAAVRAHNENFMGTIKRELPEYFAMCNDPARKAEAAKYQQDVFGWIGSKPYAEAEPLMKIAKSGQDANEIVSLLKQFESERRGGKTMPDPTGALAVPGRGAPTAPAGIGDKGDFDAGWNLK